MDEFFDFTSKAPDVPLSRLVGVLWHARGTVAYTREKIAPTGSTVAVFVLGDPIMQIPDNGDGEPLRAARGFLVGPHDRPVINEPTGETFAFGIVGTPVGCEALFGIRPSLIRGRVVDLQESWTAAAAVRAELLATDDPEVRFGVVEQLLAGWMSGLGADVDRCEAAVAMLEADPTRPIADIAFEVGLSHGQLDREFTRIVGLGPRALARLLRMRRLLSGLDVQGEIGWAGLAAELGWYDQAHLIRDFKRHTGVTPSQYVGAQRSTFSETEIGNAAGFVPEL